LEREQRADLRWTAAHRHDRASAGKEIGPFRTAQSDHLGAALSAPNGGFGVPIRSVLAPWVALF